MVQFVIGNPSDEFFTKVVAIEHILLGDMSLILCLSLKMSSSEPTNFRNTYFISVHSFSGTVAKKVAELWPFEVSGVARAMRAIVKSGQTQGDPWSGEWVLSVLVENYGKQFQSGSNVLIRLSVTKEAIQLSRYGLMRSLKMHLLDIYNVGTNPSSQLGVAVFHQETADSKTYSLSRLMAIPLGPLPISLSPPKPTTLPLAQAPPAVLSDVYLTVCEKLGNGDGQQLVTSSIGSWSDSAQPQPQKSKKIHFVTFMSNLNPDMIGVCASSSANEPLIFRLLNRKKLEMIRMFPLISQNAQLQCILLTNKYHQKNLFHITFEKYLVYLVPYFGTSKCQLKIIISTTNRKRFQNSKDRDDTIWLWLETKTFQNYIQKQSLPSSVMQPVWLIQPKNQGCQCRCQ